MALSVFNNNNNQPITANGNFCPIVLPFPGTPQQGAGQNQCALIMNVSYLFASGGTATGNINFQELGADGTWRTLVVPATVALGAALTYNGSFTGPFHGIRIAVSALAVATITYAELKGSSTNQ
jgi:hypothetical protein